MCDADVEFLQKSQYELGRFLVPDATSTYAWPYLVGLDIKRWEKYARIDLFNISQLLKSAVLDRESRLFSML